MLRLFGLTQIDMAYDGAQAVSMLNSSPDKYHLVLMDVSMPVMDGFEAMVMETCLGKSMDDYISKPMDRNMLLQKLLRWLDPVNQFNSTVSKAT